MGDILLKVMFSLWLVTGTSLVAAMLTWQKAAKAPAWVSIGLKTGLAMSAITFVAWMLWIIWAGR